MNFVYNQDRPLLEALIDGKRIIFDAQYVGDLEKAKMAYIKAFRYVGSTDTVYYDGIESTEKITHHIFVRKTI